jgi:hypothetical protein
LADDGTGVRVTIRRNAFHKVGDLGVGLLAEDADARGVAFLVQVRDIASADEQQVVLRPDEPVEVLGHVLTVTEVLHDERAAFRLLARPAGERA